MPERTSYWEHAPHDADMIVRGVGPDVGQAFEQAASAMIALVTEKPIAQNVCIDIECTAPEQEMLLSEWLNQLVYEMSSRRMIFGRFLVEDISTTRLTGKAWGEPIDQSRHQPAVEIKGATLSELRVEPLSDDGWMVQCIVDI